MRPPWKWRRWCWWARSTKRSSASSTARGHLRSAYAATTAFSCGPTITTDLANYNGMFTYLDAPEGPYRHVLLDVGSFPPNPFGLHDMHGNVAEWTLSTYRPYPYDPEDGRDALTEQGRKVVRGGSWRDRPKRATSSYRLGYAPHQRVFNVGFRITAVDESTKLVANQ